MNPGFFVNPQQGGGNMGNNPSGLPTPVVRRHTIREKWSSWESIIKDAADWVNSKIHVKRVISISVVLAHVGNEGMVVIYYNDAQDGETNAMVNAFHEYALFTDIMDTFSTWETQQSTTVEKSQQFSNSGNQIICISDLEVNEKHNRALTVIWYMKKY